MSLRLDWRRRCRPCSVPTAAGDLVNGMEAMAPITDRSRQMVVRSQLDDSGQVAPGGQLVTPRKPI